MGYYQGIGGRLVATSAEVPGTVQAPPQLIAPTNTVECSWSPSLQLTVDATWPPGCYLLKLVGSTGAHAFVPLCVRDDASESAILIMSAVTSWQAYNRWGGYSLYYGNPGGALTYTQNSGGGTYAHRARIVSFDRPYPHDWAAGASDFVGNELPLIFQAEQLGLDVSLLDRRRPARAARPPGQPPGTVQPRPRRVLVDADADGVEAAIQAGLNVGFLGANACYRQVRLEPSPLGPTGTSSATSRPPRTR